MSTVYNNLNNILVVDPNEIINENSINNATPQIQNIRSSLQFYCISRSSGNVTLDLNNKVIRVESKDTTTKVNFLGFNPDSGEYNNTYLTNINSNNREEDRYGGFGITNVSIKITANLVPEINITFLDIKSAALRDKNNPYNKLFELPPPIFKLIIKGGYGLFTEYDLHKLDQSITFESNGDSTITAKFIGDRYGVLSDVLLNYVSSVHFFKYKDIIFDKKKESRSFYEFVQKSNILYNNVDKIKTTNPLFKKKEELDLKANLIAELRNELSIDGINPVLYNKIINKDDIISIYSAYKEYKIDTNGINLNGINGLDFKGINDEYKKLGDYLNDDKNIGFTTSKLADGNTDILKTITFLNINENSEIVKDFLTKSYINGYLKKYFEDKYNKDGIDITYLFSLNTNDLSTKNLYEIILHSNTNQNDQILINKVIELEIDVKGEQEINLAQIGKLAKDIAIETVGSKPTIGNIFNFMLGDLDYFLTELKISGDEGGKRTSIGGYNVIGNGGYPAVTKQSTKNDITREVLVYPGEYNQFKDWSEIKFIDKYINSLYSRNESDALLEQLTTQKTDGSDKYIPIISNEISNTSTIKNYYFNKKDPSSIFLSLFKRYILLRDYVYNGKFIYDGEKKHNDLIEFYAKAEANNIAYSLISNKNTSDVLLNIKNYDYVSIKNSFNFNTTEIEFTNNKYNTLNYEGTLYYNRFKEVNINNDNDNTINNIISITDKIEIIDTSLSTNNNIDKFTNSSFSIFDIFDIFSTEKKPNRHIFKTKENVFGLKDMRFEESYNENLENMDSNFVNPIIDLKTQDKLGKTIFYLLVKYIKDLKIEKAKELNNVSLNDISEKPAKYFNEIFIGTVNVKQFLNKVLYYYLMLDGDDNIEDFLNGGNILTYKGYTSKLSPTYNEIPNIFIFMLAGLSNNKSLLNYNQYDLNIINNYINLYINDNDVFIIDNNKNEMNVGFNLNLNINASIDNNKSIKEIIINDSIFNSITNKTESTYNSFLKIESNKKLTNILKQKGYILVNNINAFLYEPLKNRNDINTEYFNSITYKIENETIKNDITLQKYLDFFFQELKERLKENKTLLENKEKELNSLIKDNDLKLEIYKSFKNIYDRWLYNKQYNPFTLIQNNKSIVNNETFKFVDRVYNDISQESIITYDNLIEDVKNSDTSIWTSISNVLSKNNYNFFPFQSFIPTTTGDFDLEQWKKCFQIDNKYITTNISKPCFICMYVGGFSSLPSSYEDNITNDENSDSFSLYDIYNNNINPSTKLPPDFQKLTKNNPVTAFRFSFGQQNQLVFNNISLSTTEFVNTDQSIRAADSIISRTANSNPLPKGQSLLTVYKNQSYTLSSTINYGNMSIQPTQYLQLDNVPIFNGAYMIFEVEHSIGVNEAVETKFKAYRMSRYINKIITDYAFEFFDIDTSINQNVLSNQNGLDTLKLSEHLTLASAIRSGKAKQLGISNYPTDVHLQNLKLLAEKIYEPVYSYFKNDIFISSGYRCPELNEENDGSDTSQHLTGEAFDLDSKVITIKNKDIFNYIKDNLEFDQLIWETGYNENPNWVHVSYSSSGKQRKEVKRCIKENGITKYIKYV